MQCKAVPGSNALVRCEEEVADDFYSKVGAEFRYRTLWSVSEGRMLATGEWEMTSGYWAYTVFEYDVATRARTRVDQSVVHGYDADRHRRSLKRRPN